MPYPVVSQRHEQRTALAHPGRVQFVNLGASGLSWQQALLRAPALQTDRRHLQRLTWHAQLQHLPVWRAVFGGKS